MGHITPFMYHYQKNRYMGDIDPLLWYVTLTKVLVLHMSYESYVWVLHNFDNFIIIYITL